jgi:hypothetical protein
MVKSADFAENNLAVTGSARGMNRLRPRLEQWRHCYFRRVLDVSA